MRDDNPEREQAEQAELDKLEQLLIRAKPAIEDIVETYADDLNLQPDGLVPLRMMLATAYAAGEESALRNAEKAIEWIETHIDCVLVQVDRLSAHVEQRKEPPPGLEEAGLPTTNDSRDLMAR